MFLDNRTYLRGLKLVQLYVITGLWHGCACRELYLRDETRMITSLMIFLTILKFPLIIKFSKMVDWLGFVSEYTSVRSKAGVYT